jgi:ElaB/YqjD/DUF883 family membrane-anchored ribosome-binding protein
MNTVTPEFRSAEMTDAREQASREAAREAARIGDMARDWWHRHARSTLDLAGTVKDEVAVAGERARGYVRDEPMRSVLIAAAAGAAITGLLMLFGRRR